MDEWMIGHMDSLYIVILLQILLKGIKKMLAFFNWAKQYSYVSLNLKQKNLESNLPYSNLFCKLIIKILQQSITINNDTKF